MARGKKRERWTTAYASEVLERMSRSGKSMSEMARELDVTPQRLWWWKRKLGDRGSASSVGFVEVRLAESSGGGSSFTVHAPGGWRVEVRPGFDASELQRLLLCLESSRC